MKNLVLGGLNYIEILDLSVVKEEDFATQFFLPNDDSIVGQQKLPLALPQIQELNPRVNLKINTEKLADILPSFLKNFDLVVATELTKNEILAINTHTRLGKIPLYVAGLHGMFGYILTDLVRHESIILGERGNVEKVAGTKINEVKTITNVQYEKANNKEKVTVVDEFVPLSEVFGSSKLPSQLNRRQLKRLSPAVPLIFALFDTVRPAPEEDVDISVLRDLAATVSSAMSLPDIVTEEYLELFSRQAFAEFAPVAAILGGVLAQDVIQYLGRKETPINNTLVFDATTSEMPIYYL